MKSDIARFEREIAAERAALLANLALLEDRARALTDWRGRVRKQPLAAVGVAAAGGLLLALVTSGRPDAATSNPASDADARPARLLAHPIVERIFSALAVVAAERLFAAIGVAMPALSEPPAGADTSRRPAREAP
ncbi:MAG TPA: hypothetical protein VGJ96_03220 [Gemmatimonadaceae bacterium]|jgi:hypothetical protein